MAQSELSLMEEISAHLTAVNGQIQSLQMQVQELKRENDEYDIPSFVLRSRFSLF